MNLLQAYKAVKPAIGKALLLTSIKIEASANRMVLTANNLTFSLSAAAEYEGEPFAACVNGKLLGDALERMSGPAIQFIDDKIRLSEGRARIELATSAIADFPSDLDYPDTLVIDVPRIGQHIHRVFYAAANADIRYYLNGIKLHGTPGSITAIATDGHRMAISPLAAGTEPFEIIIPRESAKQLIELDPASMVIGIDGGQPKNLTAERGDTHLTTKLIEGQFPDWKRVLPDYKRYVSAGRKELIASLTVLKPFAGGGGVNITTEFDLLHLRVFDVNSAAKGEDALPCEGDDNFELGFNIGYLVEAMQGMTSDAVSIQFGEDQASIRMDDGDYSAVVMPMRN